MRSRVAWVERRSTCSGQALRRTQERRSAKPGRGPAFADHEKVSPTYQERSSCHSTMCADGSGGSGGGGGLALVPRYRNATIASVGSRPKAALTSASYAASPVFHAQP